MESNGKKIVCAACRQVTSQDLGEAMRQKNVTTQDLLGTNRETYRHSCSQIYPYKDKEKAILRFGCGTNARSRLTPLTVDTGEHSARRDHASAVDAG